MREILYKGKPKNELIDWVYGYYFYSELTCKHCIMGESKDYGYNCIEVIPETVGQYTGLKDKNGTKIFEWDIVRYNTIATNEKITYGVIRYRNTYEQYRTHNPSGFIIDWQKNNLTGRTLREDLPFWCDTISNMETIGNIHDNPELLNAEDSL